MTRPSWIMRAIARIRGDQSISQLLSLGLDSTGNFRAARTAYIDGGCAWAVTIGDGVILAPGVKIIAHDAAAKRLMGYTAVRPVVIGARTYVGTGSVVLPGVTIGADCVIGAGSVVTREVPDGMVAVGNPAHVVGPSAELRERHVQRMAETVALDIRLEQATDPERRQLRTALREHGIIYVP